MHTFFRSPLCADFWKFIVLGCLIVGFLSAAGFTASLIFAQDWDGVSFGIALFSFFVGSVYGIIAAILGFWIVYGAARAGIVSPFSTLVSLTGLFLGLAVLVVFYWNATFLNFSFELALFPGVPFIGSLYFFHMLSERYIRPHLR